MQAFKEKVLKIVSQIPNGKVMSYGQVALVCGEPRMARQVGWILNGLNEKQVHLGEVPWWRVVNRDGIITISGNKSMLDPAFEQKRRLVAENVPFISEFKIDMKTARFIPYI